MEIWKADQEVVDMAEELIKNHHPDLVIVMDEIAFVFREKASKRGEHVVLGTSKKAAPVIKALSGIDYKFIIELAADEWQSLSSRQKQALLDHHLCACRVEEDAEDGSVKCTIAPPDVSFYWDELDRWGDWRPHPDRGNGPPPDVKGVFMQGNEIPEA